MASDVSAKSSLSEEAPQAAPSEALELADSPSNGAYRLKVAKSIDILPGGRKLLAVTTLLCIALFAVGIRFGRRGLLREQSSQSIPSPSSYSQQDVTEGVADKTAKLGEVVSTVDADRFSVARKIEEQEERIAALKEGIDKGNQSLIQSKQRYSGRQGQQDGAIGKAYLFESHVLERLILMAQRQRRAVSLLFWAARVIEMAVEREDNASSDKKQFKVLGDQEEITPRKSSAALTERVIAAHARYCSTLRQAIESLPLHLGLQQQRLSLLQGVEKEVERLLKTMHELKRTTKDLSITVEEFGKAARSVNTTGTALEHKRELKDVMEKIGSLAVRMRHSQEKHLASMYCHTGATGETLRRHFECSGKSWKNCATHNWLATLVDKIVRTVDAMKRGLEKGGRQPSTRMLELAARHVPLAVSKVLNERQVAWEEKEAHRISQMKQRQYIRDLDETEEELVVLYEVKEKLVALAREARREPLFQDELAYWEGVARVFVLKAEPMGDPLRFYVNSFKRVDAGVDEKGSGILFEYLGVLRGGPEGLVLNVRPVDMRLQGEIGSLMMNIFVNRSAATKAERVNAYIKTSVAFDAERDALRKLAVDGETVLNLTKRTGVIGAHYVGEINGWNDAFESLGAIALPKVTFSPPVTVDVMLLNLTSSEPLSMDIRVYIAQSILRSVAHIHKSGYVLNDLNAGVTDGGRIVVSDLRNITELSSPRLPLLATSRSLESSLANSEKVFRDAEHVTESWRVGMMLYMIFSGGVLPVFLDEIVDKLLDPSDVAYGLPMASIGSPAPQLRRYGTPEVWIKVISLLLQRNAEVRPTVLQVLQAYPELSSGPLKALQVSDVY